MRYLFVFLLAIAAASAVWAETYEWVDSAGVTHFTDDLDRVPAKYRVRLRERESVKAEEKKASSGGDKAAAVVENTPVKAAELYGGHAETWWRSRYADIRREIGKLQGDLPAKREDLTQLHRKWVISKGRTPKPDDPKPDTYFTKDGTGTNPLNAPGRRRVAYFEKKAEIEKDQARIEELEGQLKALDSEAASAGVPMDWRK